MGRIPTNGNSRGAPGQGRRHLQIQLGWPGPVGPGWGLFLFRPAYTISHTFGVASRGVQFGLRRLCNIRPGIPVQPRPRFHNTVFDDHDGFDFVRAILCFFMIWFRALELALRIFKIFND